MSIPGEPMMRFESRPGSTLPNELRALGYVVTPVGTIQRIIPNAIAVEIAAELSSMPPLRREMHAGMIQTEVYELTLPPGALP